MLSVQFLRVRDLFSRPHAEEGKVTWSIQVQGGSSRCVHLDRAPEKQDNIQRGVPAGAVVERAGDATISPLCTEEVEVDSEGQDSVEIALRFESTATNEREKTCHWVTTIEVEEFRLKPDQTFTLWKRLRPVASSGDTNDHEFGAIQMSVTYAVDYVEEGYWFAFFCGLLPVPLILLWADNAKPSSTGSTNPNKNRKIKSAANHARLERNC